MNSIDQLLDQERAFHFVVFVLVKFKRGVIGRKVSVRVRVRVREGIKDTTRAWDGSVDIVLSKREWFMRGVLGLEISLPLLGKYGPLLLLSARISCFYLVLSLGFQLHLLNAARSLVALISLLFPSQLELELCSNLTHTRSFFSL